MMSITPERIASAMVSGLVTRLVVRPVRLAARTAQRLSAGLLDQRMVVRGEDDLARLAASFNQMAANLQRRGIGLGDRVALLAPTSRPLVTTIQAVWLAGATVVVLPLPLRLGSVEDFVAQTRARVRSADVGLTLVDSALDGEAERTGKDYRRLRPGEFIDV